jgi:dimeric dUTPase (all-alpha-NTP-PPase superfamily)
MPRFCIKYQEEVNVNMKMQVKEIANTEVKFKIWTKEKRIEPKKSENILQ